MVGRGLRDVEAEKGLKRPAVAASSRDGSLRGQARLRVEAFEKVDEEHAEIDAGRNARSATSVGSVIRSTKTLDESVEGCFVEKIVELGIKWMTRRLRKIVRRHP